MGLQQKEIVSILRVAHGIIIGERTLRRILNNLGLFRRQQFTDLQIVANFIENQVRTSWV